ncbi:restriction endonuclease [Paenibacillus sp. FSL P4-0502]|uniref:restriction endonuclease n=1 Tax=Paenibacillus sp. FSL P4-0502 TaxID=2975319 RepID=UPI0030FAAAB1
METRDILISITITSIIFLVFKIRKIMREHKLLIDRLKKNPSVQKQLEAMIYFRGKENLSHKNLRDSEIMRIISDLENYYGFRKISKSQVKLAFSELINEMNSKAKENHEMYVEKTDITTIDQFGGIQFEYFLKSLFMKQGFQVTMTPGSGDQGVDLILNNGSRKIAIQAKRYNVNSKVGLSAIQEVYTGMQVYGCNEAYVITTSHFTNQAINLGNKVGVKLLDRNGLQKLLNGKMRL